MFCKWLEASKGDENKVRFFPSMWGLFQVTMLLGLRCRNKVASFSFSHNLHRSYYDNPPGCRYCFPPSDTRSNAWAPLLPYSTQETVSEVASKHWCRLTFCGASCLKSFFSWNSLLFRVLKMSAIKASSDFFLERWTCLGARGRFPAPRIQSALRWVRCCIAMETGCLPWLLQLIRGFVWMSVRIASTPQHCGVNATQKSTLVFLFSPPSASLLMIETHAICPSPLE